MFDSGISWKVTSKLRASSGCPYGIYIVCDICYSFPQQHCEQDIDV